MGAHGSGSTWDVIAERRRVLLVEDEISGLRPFGRGLDKHHDVTRVQAGDALRRIGSGEAWDVILAFIIMSEMSGFEFSRRVRAARADLGERLVLMASANASSHVANLQARSPVRIVHVPDSLECLLRLVAETVPPGCVREEGLA